MIKRLFFKFGPFGVQEPLVLSPSAMTVFVGPNNSGKSLVLRELGQYAEKGRTASTDIVDWIELSIPSEDEAGEMLREREVRVLHGRKLAEGQVHLARPVASGGSSYELDVHRDQLLGQLSGFRSLQQKGVEDCWKECWPGIYSQFVAFFTIALDGATRLALTEQRPGGDLQAAPTNHLAALFQQGKARERVRRIINEAFKLWFVIDPTNLGQLRIRMSKRPPADDSEEQALNPRARSFHAAATNIAELSDGVRAFTGLISALISSDYRIMLVDEPEAFLHPSLAEQLGKEMATLAAERSANVFVSTHSSRFLMGCVKSGKPTNIIRLTYERPDATARLLPASRIQELMRDPLLRSARVLESLFYSGVVVCEADRDRVFYEEINNRMQADGRTSIQNTVFLNAQNKQTIRRIVGPLREMGIPAAAIVDLDVLKGDDLKNLLNDCFVPEGIVQSLGQLRGNVLAQFQHSDLNMKDGGVSLLSADKREACQSLLDQLSEYGIFVVPIGEVESWLSYLGVAVRKEHWLPEMFEKMGSDPSENDYVRPGTGNVWSFIEQIANWMRNKDRKGMPRP